MMTDTKLSFLLGAILFLSGCAVMPKAPPHQKAGIKPDTATPNAELAEAAVSVSRSLSELASIEKAATPATKRLVSVDIPGTVSVDWSGPVEPLLQQIASMSSYRFRVLGVRPAIPVIVSLNAKDLPLSSVVRDVDFQSAKKASVMVYPQTRIIELRYMRA